MRGKLKRILTDKTKFAILAFLAVMMIVGFGLMPDAEAAIVTQSPEVTAMTSGYSGNYTLPDATLLSTHDFDANLACSGGYVAGAYPGADKTTTFLDYTAEVYLDWGADALDKDVTMRWASTGIPLSSTINIAYLYIDGFADGGWAGGSNTQTLEYSIDGVIWTVFATGVITNADNYYAMTTNDVDGCDAAADSNGWEATVTVIGLGETTIGGPAAAATGIDVTTAVTAMVTDPAYDGTTMYWRYTSNANQSGRVRAFSLDMVQMYIDYTPAITGDTLTASANTAIASVNPTEGDTGILMQRFQVDSDAADSSTVELNSLTIQDDGNATSLTGYVYIDTISQTTLPGTAVLLGTTAAWDGISQAVILSGGTLADRTVTNGTPKYIYIVYDVPSGQGGNTIQSNVTVVGVVTPDSGASAIGTSTALTVQSTPKDTLTASANTAIASGSPASNVPPLLMQRFQVDSDNVLDGSVVLNSLGLQDDGNVASITNAYVYIDDTSSATLPGTASLLGSTGAWDGTYKSIILSGDTTVLFGISRYIYIVYDLDNGTSGSTIQSNVMDVGVVGPDLGATAIGTSNLLTIGACSDPDPSTITLSAAQSASGDPFNASHIYSTTGDVGSIECKLTEGGGGGTITAIDQWANLGTDGGTGTLTGTATISAGTDRLLVLSVTGEYGTAGDFAAPTATCNGATFLEITSYGNSRESSWLGYLDEANTATCAAGGGSISITLNGATVPTADAYVATYQNVDQTTPINATFTDGDAGTGAGGPAMAFSLASDNGGFVFYVLATNGTTGTPPVGYTEHWDTGAFNGYGMMGGSMPMTVTGTESATVTLSAADRVAMTVASLTPAVGETICSDFGVNACNSLPATGTCTLVDATDYNLYVRGTDPDCNDPVTGSANPETFTWNACTDTTPSNLVITVPALNNSTVGGPVTITATSDEQLSLGLPTVTVSGTTGGLCDVSAQNMTESGTGPYTYTYSWSTALCGDPIENPITITINGDDPECTVPQQAQWTNITIDNTCPNADTLSLVVADNITLPTAITATGTASNIQVQWQEDGGAWSGWVANGSVYTPTNQCSSGTVNFQAKGDDSNCGVDAHLVTDAGGTYQPFDDLATITITKPTSGGNVYGVYTVQAQIGVETTPNGMTSMQMTSVGSACDVTATAMGWEAINAGSNRWEANWDVSTCGSPEELGVTLDVSGVDPDCPGTINASQVTSLTVSTGPVFTITSCSGCHALPPTDGARNASTGAVVGSHSVADHLGATCTKCHIDNGTAASAYPQGLGHREGLIELLTTIHGQAGSSYSKGTSIAQSDAPTLGTCATTLCHGTSSPTWGTSVPASGTCVKCHGESGVGTPTDAQIAPGGAGVDLGGASATTDAQVGMHQTHLNASNSYSSPVPCSECHSIYTAPSDAGHWDASAPWDGAATMNWGASATGSLEGPGTTPSFDSGGTLDCSNVYCHDGQYFKNANGNASASGSDVTPTWNVDTYLNGTPSLAGDCAVCHDGPPANAIVSSHSGSEVLADCTTCHGHFNANGTLNQPELHVNGLVEGAGDCIVCHDTGGAGTTGPNTRDAVMTEFGLAWGHKKSGRTAVTNSDCIVCHLEGDFASQSPSAYHNDGNIDLRDPDGAGETPITNIAGGAWTFTKFATSYAAGSRTTTGHTLENVDNIITQKFCLACHDADGATNTTARTVAGTPTAFSPWEGISTGYATADGAAAVNGLIDVKTAVSAASSSMHPMTAPRSAGYPTTALMNSPYDNFTRTAGTLANSVVLNCFDCHNAPTPLTTRTTVAHGSNATDYLRGRPTVATAGDSNPNATTGSTLCFVCHSPTTSGDTSHKVGSGFGDGGGKTPMDVFVEFGCNMCHASGYDTAVVRPIRAQDVHGYPNTVSGATTHKVAFIRGNSTDGYITGHNPTDIGGTAYTADCTGMGGTICAGARTKTYTPGGVY